MPLSSIDLNAISDALGVPAEREGSIVRYSLAHEESGRRLALEVVPSVAMPSGEDRAVVSVYSTGSFLQLQDCRRVVPSPELGEVLFLSRESETVNGLVVEKEAGCSLYAGVPAKLLNADFTSLPPELMSSAVVLSLGETVLESDG